MSDTTELQKVRESLNTWLAAFNRRDLDALLAGYDPESVYANAGAPLMRGVGEIGRWFAQAFENMTAKIEFREEAIFQDGAMALLVGKFHFRPAEGGDGPTGRVGIVYRRARDGQWRLLFDMDNSPPDVKPIDFAEVAS